MKKLLSILALLCLAVGGAWGYNYCAQGSGTVCDTAPWSGFGKIVAIGGKE